MRFQYVEYGAVGKLIVIHHVMLTVVVGKHAVVTLGYIVMIPPPEAVAAHHAYTVIVVGTEGIVILGVFV